MLIWPKFSRLLGNVWGVICAGFTGMVFDGIVVGGETLVDVGDSGKTVLVQNYLRGSLDNR